MDPFGHIAVLCTNGQRKSSLDPAAPRADISAYLRKGINDVDIVVSTPLGNALVSVAGKLRGAGPDLSLVKSALGVDLIVVRENGLVGKDVVRP